MNFKPIILNGFYGREEELERIKRYYAPSSPVMFYRTNDLIHCKRVRWHLEEASDKLKKVYKNNIDINFARTLAEVHDDAEIITGDITLYDKETMSEKQLEELALKEKQAIPLLIKKYSQFANNYNYEELLFAAKNKNIIEAQFVSFFDKFDAAGEAWHEVWAGNEFFTLSAGGKDSISGGYIRRLNEFSTKYPQMQEFFEKFPEYLPKPIDLTKITKHGKPHTRDSLEKNTNYVPYERWKRTIMKNEGIDFLITQIEFY